VDVWIDEEGLVRRIALEDGGSPAAVEFFDFGVEVDIEAPPPDSGPWRRFSNHTG
jgi:hypothetical protein